MNRYHVYIMSLPSVGAKIQWPNIIRVDGMIMNKTAKDAAAQVLCDVENDVIDAATVIDAQTMQITRFAVSKTKQLEQINLPISPKYALSFAYRENGKCIIVPFATDLFK